MPRRRVHARSLGAGRVARRKSEGFLLTNTNSSPLLEGTTCLSVSSFLLASKHSSLIWAFDGLQGNVVISPFEALGATGQMRIPPEAAPTLSEVGGLYSVPRFLPDQD